MSSVALVHALIRAVARLACRRRILGNCGPRSRGVVLMMVALVGGRLWHRRGRGRDTNGTTFSSLVRQLACVVVREAVLAALDALVDSGRPAPRPAAQFERVRQDLQEGLQVLLGSLWAPGKGDDETAGSGPGGAVDEAGDRARERSKWGDGERGRDHGRHEARSRPVNQRGYRLPSSVVSQGARLHARDRAPRTSGVESLVPNPVPPDVRIKSIPRPTQSRTVCASSGLSSATIRFSAMAYTPCCLFKTSRRVGRERSEVGSCAAVSDTHSKPTETA